MKKERYIYACLATALTATALTAGGYRLTSFRASRPVSLHVPVAPDTTDSENPFKTESLLDARRDLPDPANAGWTTMVADTAGVLRLASPSDTPALQTFTTRLRADRFAKGRLVLSSTARAAVRVNGEKLITKAASDSLRKEAETPLTLEPEADKEIVIDILGVPDDKSIPEFSLEFIPADEFSDVAVTASPDLRKRVAPLTTMTGERTTSVRLSSDGRYLLSTTREVISAKETIWRTSLTETATGRVLSADINDRASWIPGTSAFFHAVGRNGAFDYYRTEVPSMRSTLMAKGIPDRDAVISPDGRYLFYYKSVEADKESGPMHRYKSPDDRIPGDRDRSYIMRYDVNNKVSEPLTFGGPTTSIYDFTRKGDKMLFGAMKQTPDRYPFYNFTLIEMNMATLATDTLISHMEATVNNAIYSPDGKQLFITAGPTAFGGIGANFAPHEIGNDFDGQGFIFDIATRKARAVTRDFDPAVEASSVWSAADNRIYFLGEEGFGKNIYSLNPADGRITRLNTAAPYVRNFTLGETDGTWLAYTGGSFTSDGAAYLYNLKKNTSRLLADPLAETTKDIEFGEMTPWKFTAKDGTIVDGWMCLPPGFDPEKKYPLIVYYYGGTSPSNATFYHLYTPQVFASRDYVVYVLNPSGTTGYGQEYSARHVNAWGKRTAEEIIEGTKLFCKEHKFIDDKKIGCIGASYGGFMTQYLQTLTDIFAAAVSHAGISNVTSYWGEGFWGYSYNSVAAAKSYPWSDPELFTKQGSLFNADKIHTPLLLLHGTVDTNVPIGESIQLFNALRILGRDVEFITVQDENHVISGFDNKLAWQNTIMAWFAKYLQDDPRWWNELYGK